MIKEWVISICMILCIVAGFVAGVTSAKPVVDTQISKSHIKCIP